MPTELLPQPPPGAPAPPPGEEAIDSRRKFRWIIGLGVGSLLVVVLPLLMPPMLIESKKQSNLVTATCNARQIGQALLEFENLCDKYPDATTAQLIKDATGSTWTLSDATSNDLFQQLLVSGIAPSEEIFDDARTPWTRKVDNLFTSESQALAAGECGFAYIAGLSSKDHPATPVCVTPLEPGKLTFDRKSFDGKAIILRVDNSAIALPIDRSGRAILNGMDLFDPRQPFWHGKAPNVKWPK
jgi:hypothetical protein